jgi:anaerobic sulfite reductase subunit A
MSYRLNREAAQALTQNLCRDYEVWAPKRFPKEGRYADTDLIKYDKISAWDEIVFDEKSLYPAKEVLSPICQTTMYFTEDEYRESKCGKKPLLVFMRPCDVNAMQRQEKIYLGNGGFSDFYYARMRDRLKIALIECTQGWDTCFCVSMGTNEARDYALALRPSEGGAMVELKDKALEHYFAGTEAVDFRHEFVKKNETTVTVPEIADKETLLKLKNHPMWNEFNSRCISCGACTLACATCTCFSSRDITYGDNPEAGERRRVEASCQTKDFDEVAGGGHFRKDAAARMRYKIMHKFHDYKARFGDYHMCVGCGRCSDVCPELINVTATVKKMSAALEEIKKEGQA